MGKNDKKSLQTIYKKIDSIEDLKMSLLNFIFAMIYRIHKMLVLFKKHLNLKDNILKYFFKKYNSFF